MHAQQTLAWTELVCCSKHTKQNKLNTHTHTLSSFSLLALQAVSHPSIHVTKRWVHPVTGQLVAVTLMYVAPLSSLFLLWWRDYACLLPIRKVYSACNGGPVGELSQGRKKSPCMNKLMASWLGSITLCHSCSFVIQTWTPEAYCTGLLSHFSLNTPQSYRQEILLILWTGR